MFMAVSGIAGQSHSYKAAVPDAACGPQWRSTATDPYPNSNYPCK